MGDKCKARVHDSYGVGFHPCMNKAGFGPDKAYCKIHAREKGEKFGKIVTLYRAMPEDWRGPMGIAEIEAEELPKTYKLSGEDGDFDYARTISKDQAGRQGIFLTKEEALAYFVKTVFNKVKIAIAAAQKAQDESVEVLKFAEESGLDWEQYYEEPS